MSTATQDRALKLLGQNLAPAQVSLATGLSISRISQLLSDPLFLSQVNDLRYARTSKAAEIDDTYDLLEEKVQEKLKSTLPFLMNPMQVLKAAQVLNSMKRRTGLVQDQEAGSLDGSRTVTINMPTQIVHSFTFNINNQIIKAGEQELVTIQSGSMDSLVQESAPSPKNLLENKNVQNPSSSAQRAEDFSSSSF